MKSIALLIFLATLNSCAQHSQPSDGTAMAQQHLLVVAASNNSQTGMLYRMEFLSGKWQRVGHAIAVVVGKNGVSKTQEGDARSPSGQFELDTIFGYQQQTPAFLKMPYLALQADTECVDDTDSSYYNQILNRQTVARSASWQSSEKMRRDIHHADDLYKWGIVVRYNHNPASFDGPRNRKGSCIFLHVWRDATQGTAGCTAMSESDLVAILNWLDQKKQPLLVQGTKAQLQQLQLPYSIPAAMD